MYTEQSKMPDPEPIDWISLLKVWSSTQHIMVYNYSISSHIKKQLGVEELHPAAQLIIKHTQNDVYGQTW